MRHCGRSLSWRTRIHGVQQRVYGNDDCIQRGAHAIRTWARALPCAHEARAMCPWSTSGPLPLAHTDGHAPNLFFPLFIHDANGPSQSPSVITHATRGLSLYSVPTSNGVYILLGPNTAVGLEGSGRLDELLTRNAAKAGHSCPAGICIRTAQRAAEPPPLIFGPRDGVP